MIDKNQPLAVVYIVQNAFMDLTAGKGVQMKIRGLLRALRHFTPDVTLVALDKRHGLIAGGESAGREMVLEAQKVSLPLTGNRIFRFVEKQIRRSGNLLRIPYLHIFDTMRLFETGWKPARHADIIHTHFDMVPLAATLLSYLTGKPLVIDCEADWFDEFNTQGLELNPFLARWARFTQRLCLRRAAAVICVSNDLREHYRTRWGVQPEILHVLPNGVDIERFSARQYAPEWRERLQLADSGVLIFVGGFFRWHALDQLVSSFYNVRQNFTESRLLLVGDGLESQNIQRQVGRLGLENSVTFVGHVSPEQIPSLIALADIAVAPFEAFSSGESRSPLKLFEYMAAGKAIVATATGQVAEIVEDGVTALLVQPGDVAGFAAAVNELLGDDYKRALIARNAKQAALEKHSWRHYGAALMDIYEAILEHGRSTHQAYA